MVRVCQSREARLFGAWCKEDATMDDEKDNNTDNTDLEKEEAATHSSSTTDTTSTCTDTTTPDQKPGSGDRSCSSDDDDDDTSICSSDRALCDVLGLSSLAGMVMEDDVENDVENDKEPDGPLPSGNAVHRRIDLPPTEGVSRKYYPPGDCFAYEIPNVLSPEECRRLISVAAHSNPKASANLGANGDPCGPEPSSSSSSSSSFRYVTHAVHTAPDGETKFEVALERPNPHKLAVFRHASWVETLWNRLGPLLVKPRAGESTTTDPPLWKALQHFIHRESLGGPPVGLNPRLRVLKYDATDRDEFLAHFDATTELFEPSPRTSYLTVLLYLNDGGGETEIGGDGDTNADFSGGETEFLSQHDASGGRTIVPRAGSVVLFEHDLFHRGRPLVWGTKYVLRTDVMFATKPRDDSASGKGPLPPAMPRDNRGSEPLPPQLSTVEDVLGKLKTDELESDDPFCFLRDALSNGMGFGGDLEGTSIECLCSAGRFPLSLMLREHVWSIAGLLSSPPQGTEAEVTTWKQRCQKEIDRFLDIAFEALRQAK